MEDTQSSTSNNIFKSSRLFIWSIISILLLVLYREALIKWGSDIWTDPNYSHGMLIPLESLYLIKQRFTRLRETQSLTCNKGLLFILPALLLFVLGSVAGEQFSQRVSFVILLYGLVLFI